MNNVEIARSFKLLAELMELYGENEFKTKSYHFAARVLKNLNTDLTHYSIQEIEQIQGIGKAIAQKIHTLIHENKLELLEKYLSITPHKQKFWIC